jgi:hypothetical protein
MVRLNGLAGALGWAASPAVTPAALAQGGAPARVMAAIAESGLRNLRGDTYSGFFGVHESLNAGEYRGFPRNPQLQVSWFIESASGARQRRVAEGRPDPASDERAFGSWRAAGRIVVSVYAAGAAANVAARRRSVLLLP